MHSHPTTALTQTLAMDQDDSMLSTPSSHGNDDTLDEESLFPSETVHNSSYVAAQTPQNDHLNAAAPGELSPPRSQSISQNDPNGFGHSAGQGSILPGAEDLSDDEVLDMKGDRALTDERNKPGVGWKNKKTQEEMQRTWESVVDKDFDMRQYGDPLQAPK